ncbi:unnamed protein product [Amoebophrya sp. A120]|nr:unnamed protein product [Amoebophrya sp. A120]|eukprot:GSA120T00008024001.1
MFESPLSKVLLRRIQDGDPELQVKRGILLTDQTPKDNYQNGTTEDVGPGPVSFFDAGREEDYDYAGQEGEDVGAEIEGEDGEGDGYYAYEDDAVATEGNANGKYVRAKEPPPLSDYEDLLLHVNENVLPPLGFSVQKRSAPGTSTLANKGRHRAQAAGGPLYLEVVTIEKGWWAYDHLAIGDLLISVETNRDRVSADSLKTVFDWELILHQRPLTLFLLRPPGVLPPGIVEQERARLNMVVGPKFGNIFGGTAAGGEGASAQLPGDFQQRHLKKSLTELATGEHGAPTELLLKQINSASRNLVKTRALEWGVLDQEDERGGAGGVVLHDELYNDDRRTTTTRMKTINDRRHVDQQTAFEMQQALDQDRDHFNREGWKIAMRRELAEAKDQLKFSVRSTGGGRVNNLLKNDPAEVNDRRFRLLFSSEHLEESSLGVPNLDEKYDTTIDDRTVNNPTSPLFHPEMWRAATNPGGDEEDEAVADLINRWAPKSYALNSRNTSTTRLPTSALNALQRNYLQQSNFLYQNQQTGSGGPNGNEDASGARTEFESILSRVKDLREDGLAGRLKEAEENLSKKFSTSKREDFQKYYTELLEIENAEKLLARTKTNYRGGTRAITQAKTKQAADQKSISAQDKTLAIIQSLERLGDRFAERTGGAGSKGRQKQQDEGDDFEEKPTLTESYKQAVIQEHAEFVAEKTATAVKQVMEQEQRKQRLEKLQDSMLKLQQELEQQHEKADLIQKQKEKVFEAERLAMEKAKLNAASALIARKAVLKKQIDGTLAELRDNSVAYSAASGGQNFGASGHTTAEAIRNRMKALDIASGKHYKRRIKESENYAEDDFSASSTSGYDELQRAAERTADVEEEFDSEAELVGVEDDAGEDSEAEVQELQNAQPGPHQEENQLSPDYVVGASGSSSEQDDVEEDINFEQDEFPDTPEPLSSEAGVRKSEGENDEIEDAEDLFEEDNLAGDEFGDQDQEAEDEYFIDQQDDQDEGEVFAGSPSSSSKGSLSSKVVGNRSPLFSKIADVVVRSASPSERNRKVNFLVDEPGAANDEAEDLSEAEDRFEGDEDEKSSSRLGGSPVVHGDEEEHEIVAAAAVIDTSSPAEQQKRAQVATDGVYAERVAATGDVVNAPEEEEAQAAAQLEVEEGDTLMAEEEIEYEDDSSGYPESVSSGDEVEKQEVLQRDVQIAGYNDATEEQNDSYGGEEEEELEENEELEPVAQDESNQNEFSAPPALPPGAPEQSQQPSNVFAYYGNESGTTRHAIDLEKEMKEQHLLEEQFSAQAHTSTNAAEVTKTDVKNDSTHHFLFTQDLLQRHGKTAEFLNGKRLETDIKNLQRDLDLLSNDQSNSSSHEDDLEPPAFARFAPPRRQIELPTRTRSLRGNGDADPPAGSNSTAFTPGSSLAQSSSTAFLPVVRGHVVEEGTGARRNGTLNPEQKKQEHSAPADDESESWSAWRERVLDTVDDFASGRLFSSLTSDYALFGNTKIFADESPGKGSSATGGSSSEENNGSD